MSDSWGPDQYLIEGNEHWSLAFSKINPDPGPVLKIKTKANPQDLLDQAIPVLHTATVDCPVGYRWEGPKYGYCYYCYVNKTTRESSISSMILHLNDFHEWSREQIADWLESLDIDLSFERRDE